MIPGPSSGECSTILPTQKNLNKTCRRVQSPNCVLCEANVPDDIRDHCFTFCSQSTPAMNWLLSIVETMDPTANLRNIVNLQIEPANPEHLLECIGMKKETVTTSVFAVAICCLHHK